MHLLSPLYERKSSNIRLCACKYVVIFCIYHMGVYILFPTKRFTAGSLPVNFLVNFREIESWIWSYDPIWSDDQMIRWSYDQMIIWSSDHMIIWSYDHMIIWSYDHMIIWSYDHMIIWSYDHMIWSYDLMIIWSYDHKIIILLWSYDHISHAAVPY